MKPAPYIISQDGEEHEARSLREARAVAKRLNADCPSFTVEISAMNYDQYGGDDPEVVETFYGLPE